MLMILMAAYSFYRASCRMHDTLLSNVLKTRMSFFDAKPLGMIINRFAKDMSTIGQLRYFIFLHRI